MTEINSTRLTTETLRGIAITTVLINHFVSLHSQDDFDGFASLFVAVFFLLSGYGLSFSLERYLAMSPGTGLLLYFYERLTRIFPLYWIALLVQSLVTGQRYTLLNYLGIRGAGHYWFIPALLQCYVLSGLFFIAHRPQRKVLAMIVAGGILVVLNVYVRLNSLSVSWMQSLGQYHFTYRSVLGLHWGLFFLGYCVYLLLRHPRVLSFFQPLQTFPGLLIRQVVTLMMFVSLLIGMIITKYAHWPNMVFMVMPLPPLLLIGLYMLIAEVAIRPFAFLGRISYSIYLFHMSYYLIIGFLFSGGWYTLTITALLFPLFVVVCIWTEKQGDRLAQVLRRWVSPDKRVPTL